MSKRDIKSFPSIDRAILESRGGRFSFLISAAGAFLLYRLTMAPGVTLEYSGYKAAAADNLGVPDVPGYAIWTLVGWACIRLMELLNLAGESGAAWSLNLLSVVCGALTCGVLSSLIFQTSRKGLGEHTPPAVLIAAAVAASWTYAAGGVVWSQSVITEHWTLNTFLMSLMLYCSARWFHESNQKIRVFLCACFLAGCMTVNARFLGTMLLMLPFLLIRSHGHRRVVLLLSGTAAVLISFLWLLVPVLGAHFDSPVRWLDASRWEAFFHMIGQGQFEKIYIGRNLGTLITAPGPTLREMVHILGSISLWQYLAGYWIIAAVGLAAALRVKSIRTWGAVLTVLWILLGPLMAIAVVRIPGDLQSRMIARVHYIPFFLITAIFLGYGLIALYGAVTRFSCREQPLP